MRIRYLTFGLIQFMLMGLVCHATARPATLNVPLQLPALMA